MRWLSILCSVVTAWGADASSARIREAATRALALFQISQKTWYEKVTCGSCHHQYQPALTYRSAREHGISFDESIAHADAVRAFSYTDLDRAVQYNYVIEPAMDDAYRLVAADAAGVRPNLVTAVYARLIASRQNPDGSWDSFHQRPPASYSRFTQTTLALRAIQLYGHPSQQTDLQARVTLARNWLLANSPRDIEERTYQLLGLAWAGADKAAIVKAARALKALQQPDCGWNALEGRPSDAYSTSETLVALHDAGGVPVTDVAWQRGIEFLLKTQAADGSWHVVSRLLSSLPMSPPYFESGYPYGHDQFLSAAAADWAVMALAQALGAAHPRKISLQEAEPTGVPAWVETVLFGGVAELQHLIERGFDPNSATSGGTTALMMAAPDAAKMKLLLDRGANINARAKTRYTALMVATQYRDSTAAVRLLLDRGAEVRPAADQPAPLFSAHPLFLAAYAGNAEVLRSLRDAGDKVDEPMKLIGTNSTTALMGAVKLGNTNVAKALLDLGAEVEQADGGAVTALGRAVLGNQLELAHLLIERGADVNRVDKRGMTPLLYAASADFGDSAMVDLLLKSGAHAGAAGKEGLTAIDLARKYQRQHLLDSLTAAAAK